MLIFGKIPDERQNLFNKLWSTDEKVKTIPAFQKCLSLVAIDLII